MLNKAMIPANRKNTARMDLNMKKDITLSSSKPLIISTDEMKCLDDTEVKIIYFLLIQTVVGSLFGDDHVMDVTFSDSCG